MRRRIHLFVLLSWLMPCPPLQAACMFVLTFCLAFRFADRHF